jgi:hypothetical protein
MHKRHSYQLFALNGVVVVAPAAQGAGRSVFQQVAGCIAGISVQCMLYALTFLMIILHTENNERLISGRTYGQITTNWPTVPRGAVGGMRTDRGNPSTSQCHFVTTNPT